MVPDREKVIRAVETCFDSWIDKHRNMGLDLHEVKRLKREALELLKEQEPVKAVADGEDSYICNNCGTVIGWAEWEPGGIEEVKYKFCPECGRTVKWDD